MPADKVRPDSHRLRPVAVDGRQAEAIKVVTRMHKALVWERTRHPQPWTTWMPPTRWSCWPRHRTGISGEADDRPLP
jgi:hypothetical protein